MKVEFVIDADTGEPHIYNHGVRETEVLEILGGNPLRVAGERGARIAMGQTATGRYLRVVYRTEAERLLVVTAYDMNPKALKAYRRRRRRKS